MIVRILNKALGILNMSKQAESSPIFIGGEGRSGTTLMRVILDSHPHISCGPETHLFIDPKFEELYRYFCSEKYLSRVAEFSESNPRKYLAQSFAAILEMFHGELMRKNKKLRWADKTPLNILKIDFLRELFPNLKFIHMIRDGRDVASSILTKDWGPKTIKGLANRWVKIIETGLKHKGQPYFLEVKYEDLVHEPEDVIKKLMRFLQEPYSPQLLHYHRVKHLLPTTEDSSLQVQEQLHTNSIGRWKNDLTRKQVAEYEAYAKKQLNLHNYL